MAFDFQNDCNECAFDIHMQIERIHTSQNEMVQLISMDFIS